MKTRISLSIILFISPLFLVLSQVPQGFNYQAIARDGSGNPITGATIKVKLSVLSDTLGFKASGAGVYVWEEEHVNVKTNSFGLFTVTLGTGTQVGGSALSFSSINWNVSQLFVGVKIANPATYQIMGSARLWSVPYSMSSGSLSGPVTKLAVNGNTPLYDEALFEVKNKDGQTIFAVYNEGVRIYVDNGAAKAGRGGFAVGGFDRTKAVSDTYFIVSPDSIRAYIGPTSAKPSRGGFAVGGFDRTKAAGEEYLRVTRDSTRINVNDTDAKPSRGGFAVGGFDRTKGTTTQFTVLTPENYFIGHKAGINNIGGKYNSFLGFEAGQGNTNGMNNVFLGYQAGYSNNTGLSNIFIGNRTGFKNISGYSNAFFGTETGLNNAGGYDNCFIGYQAGFDNIDGFYHCFLGYQAGYANKSGYGNTFIGYSAGKNHIEGVYNVYMGFKAGEGDLTGSSNVFIGSFAGQVNKGGSGNTFIGHNSGFSSSDNYGNSYFGAGSGHDNISGVFNTSLGYDAGFANVLGSKNVNIGYQTGRSNTSGNNNVFIGNQSGYLNAGDGNVFIGNQAGYSETGSDKLYISNALTEKPLLWGDFKDTRLVVGGNASDNVLNRTFYVNGTSGGDTDWFIESDSRLKKDITSIDDALYKVLQLQGIYFTWIDDERGKMGRQIGFIAQDTEKILPEVVSHNDSLYTMQYASITALLVEAMKEQQRIIAQQEERIKKLEMEISRIGELEQIVSGLTRLIK